MLAPNDPRSYSYQAAAISGAVTFILLASDISLFTGMPYTNLVLLAVSVIFTMICGTLTITGLLWPLKMKRIYKKLGYSFILYSTGLGGHWPPDDKDNDEDEHLVYNEAKWR